MIDSDFCVNQVETNNIHKANSILFLRSTKQMNMICHKYPRVDLDMKFT